MIHISVGSKHLVRHILHPIIRVLTFIILLFWVVFNLQIFFYYEKIKTEMSEKLPPGQLSQISDDKVNFQVLDVSSVMILLRGIIIQ